ncbi:hypothetical protein J5X84_11185 [Streptosporangiaceae bacterium NEAU-GS5]|nr:hypothetical protein [Streptosporangiaceae bacterium NEAU-GS5]
MAGATGVIPPGTTEAIVRALPDRLPPSFTARILAPLPPIPPGERPIEADQTNHSVVAGETVVVKWFAQPFADARPFADAQPAADARPSAGPQPALDLLAHLSAVGFTRTARPYAALFRGGALAALVTAYLPDAVDGWEWCVDEAVADRTAFAEELGLLAAELHQAMATPSEVFPDPIRVTGCAPSDWRDRARHALDEALAETRDEPWLTEHADVLRHELDALHVPAGTRALRIHGDLHVGQVLRWRDGYAVVDFDGNPTIVPPDGGSCAYGPFQPPERDFAQLATSIEHVGQVAIKRRAADPGAITAWVAAARAAFAEAYLGAGLTVDRSLARPFEIEQECRELIYAARHLPRWRYAPMGVLRSWF